MLTNISHMINPIFQASYLLFLYFTLSRHSFLNLEFLLTYFLLIIKVLKVNLYCYFRLLFEFIMLLIIMDYPFFDQNYHFQMSLMFLQTLKNIRLIYKAFY